MPLYTYTCTECGHKEERLCQAFKPVVVVYCSKCGAQAVQLVPAPARTPGKWGDAR